MKGRILAEGSGDSLLQTEPAVGSWWFLERKAEGVHTQLFHWHGGTVLGGVPGAAGFLKVVAEEPELYIRHSEPIQR